MKKLSIFLICLILTAGFYTGCKKSSSTNNNAETEKNSETSKVEKTSSSGEYSKMLDEYEKWAYDYTDLVKKIKKNPLDAAKYNNKLQKFAKEAADWTHKWQNIKGNPTKSEEERLEKINKNIENILN